jgi:predicted ArsR family transcriptional regulator
MSELLYPDRPGFKVPGPSQNAAEAVTGTAARLRAQVLAVVKASPAGISADEIAKTLNRSVLSIRPRVSELKRQGLIRETGERRRNESGMTAGVWRASPEDVAC